MHANAEGKTFFKLVYEALFFYGAEGAVKEAFHRYHSEAGRTAKKLPSDSEFKMELVNVAGERVRKCCMSA